MHRGTSISFHLSYPSPQARCSFLRVYGGPTDHLWNPNLIIRLRSTSVCPQGSSEHLAARRAESKPIELLRALHVAERDSVAIAECSTSLFALLRLALSEVIGSPVDHMRCFSDAAGCLQESAFDAATKGSRWGRWSFLSPPTLVLDLGLVWSTKPKLVMELELEACPRWWIWAWLEA